MTNFSVPDLKPCELAGGTISYREAGEGQPLLFLHGINIHSGIWGYQFPHFAANYRMIAWDAPSYGGSAPREGRIEVYAEALAEFLDELGLEKVMLVGHSMGGIIGGAFTGLYPDRLQALV
ncbi:MAG TPA: alpha/beta hydrolase, partial [Rhodospirillaceae bacterium]|nr:alpha/beta hydrolase [Rhodospirillaceae bacterium]